MPDDAPGSPLDRALRRQAQEEYQAQSQAQYEHGRVKWLLKALGGGDSSIRLALRELRDQLGGEALFTCDWFNSWIEGFPLWLGCRNLRGLHNHPQFTRKAVFTAFERTPLVQTFVEFYDEVQAQAPRDDYGAGCVGLIVPIQGFPQGLLIHSGPDLLYDGLRWFYQHPVADWKRLWVAPAKAVLTAIAGGMGGWTRE